MVNRKGFSSTRGVLSLIIISLLFISGACKLDSPYLDAIEKQIEEDLNGISTFSVLYNGNGNTAGIVPEDSNSYLEGAEAIVLGNTNGLSKDSYTFSSWNSAEDGSGDIYGEGDSILIGTADITLYAHWTSNPVYSISYNGNGNDGGEAPGDAVNYEEGQSVTVKSQGTLTLTAASFIGWNTATDGSGTDYLVDSTFPMPANDMTLYAQWTYNPTFNVIYNGNGADGGEVPSDDNNYEAGDQVTVKDSGNLGKTGYTFTNWNTQANSSGTTRTVDSIFTMGSSDIDLYAQWSPNEYEITLDHQNGSSGSDTVSVYYDAAMPSAIAPSKTGYTFGGYFSETNGSGTQYYTSTMSSSNNWNIPSDMTLYAKWIPNQYTISFNIGLGSGKPNDILVDFNDNPGSIINPTYSGYKLVGFYTEENGAGSLYYIITEQDPSSSHCIRNWDITSDTTLHAYWIEDYSVGDVGPANGIIIKDLQYYHSELNDSGEWVSYCYIECWTADESSILKWKDQPTATPETSTSVFSGYENTYIAMVSNGTHPAADTIRNASYGGYNDWYLPSLDTLTIIYENKDLAGLSGTFATTTYDKYWSSSDYDNEEFNAFAKSFYNGQVIENIKLGNLHVRAVRRF